MKDATEIVVILDRSGSMDGLASDTIGTFNKFVQEQKEHPGEASMSLILFNTEYSVEYMGKPIANVPELTNETYVPGGWTALLDAVGRGIDSLGERLDKLPEEVRPDKVIFVIITDGLENSSKEYRLEQVNAKIKHQQEKYGWRFLFLGANIDAFGEASKLGIDRKYATRYSANTIGTLSVGETVSKGVSSYRNNGTVVRDWNKDIK